MFHFADFILGNGMEYSSLAFFVFLGQFESQCQPFHILRPKKLYLFSSFFKHFYFYDSFRFRGSNYLSCARSGKMGIWYDGGLPLILLTACTFKVLNPIQYYPAFHKQHLQFHSVREYIRVGRWNSGIVCLLLTIVLR